MKHRGAAAALALGCALVLGTGAAWPAADAATAPYTAEGQCNGLPRLALQAPPGWCVGLVANAAQGLRFPRRVLEVAPGRYWLIDMGGWEPRRGRLLAFEHRPGQATPPVLRVMADQLDRPHGLVLGPDGRVYVGEAGRVWRTPVVDSAAALVRETVLDGLPADGAHPLKELAFGPGGRLFVNIGSASDACRQADGSQPGACPETQGLRPRAAVWVAQLGGPGHTVQRFEPHARGLRNSLALAWVPAAGALLQGENSIDYPEREQPAEELNLLRAGADFGWPGCVAQRQPARGYEGRVDCGATQAPLRLWPAHAAPLQMLLAPASAPAPLGGALLVAWHGPRASGHRVVRQPLDARGHPQGAPVDLIAGWQARPGRGPQGAPTGIALDHAGRLWVVEDRHRTLLLMQREAAAVPAASGPAR